MFPQDGGSFTKCLLMCSPARLTGRRGLPHCCFYLGFSSTTGSQCFRHYNAVKLYRLNVLKLNNTWWTNLEEITEIKCKWNRDEAESKEDNLLASSNSTTMRGSLPTQWWNKAENENFHDYKLPHLAGPPVIQLWPLGWPVLWQRYTPRHSVFLALLQDGPGSQWLQ